MEKPSENTIDRLRDHFDTIRTIGFVAEDLMTIEARLNKSIDFTKEMIDNKTMEEHGKLFLQLLFGAVDMIAAHKEIMRIGELMAGPNVHQGNDTVN